jgi:pimeloyl-ACP methyl ester carboxylesterase
MGYPAGLDVAEHAPRDGWGTSPPPTVVLVHGSLDRGASFARAVRRLGDLGIVTYDRRGYEGSTDEGTAVDLAGHVEDLLAVVAGAPGSGPVTAVGHSVGGDVVVAAALAEPARFSSLGAYEPPMPWLGFSRRPGRGPWTPGDPGDEAEAFFRRMVGDAAWDRLPADVRARRRAEGPALVADLLAMHGEAPFDVTALTVPVVFGRGGPASSAHHRDTVGWLASHVPGAMLVEIEGAGHGAHLSHPDGFARLVRVAVGLGTGRGLSQDPAASEDTAP